MWHHLKHTTLLIFSVIACQFNYAQNFEPIFKNISDELPSAEVYDIYQDSIGYMWFATDNGIARYDGHDVLNINTSPYFETPVVFNFFEETPHKTWVNTNDNKLYWFNPLDNHFEFHPYIYNDTLSSTIKRFHQANYIRKIYFGKNNALKVTFLKVTGYVEIDEKGNPEIKETPLENIQTHEFNGIELIIESNLVYTRFSKKYPGTLKLKHNAYKDSLLIKNFDYHSLWLYGVSDFKVQNSNKYVLIGKYFIIIKNKKINVITLPSEGLDFLLDEENIYISTFKGVVTIKNNEITNHFLKNSIITSIIKDSEKGFWFSSLDNGVFYIKDINVKQLNKKIISPKKIIVKSKYILIIKNNSEMEIFNENGDLLNSFNNVYLINENLFSKEKLPKVIFSQYVFYRKIDKMYCYYLKKENYCVNTFEYESLLDWNKNLNKPLININSIKRLRDYSVLNDSIILLSTTEGLIKYNLKTLKQKKIDIPSLNKTEVLKIKKVNHHLILFSQKYITILKRNNNLEFEYNFKNSHNKFLFENDSIIWMYNQKKIYKIFVSENHFQFKNYSNSFLDLNITALAIDSNNLWLGTRKGIIKADLSKIEDEKQTLTKNKFILDSILINQTKVKNQDTLTFMSNSNINLFFKYLTFKFNQPVKFEYQLDDETWFPTNGNNLNLKNIEYGYHTLKIRGLKYGKKGILFSKVFYVKPLFTETPWFYILLIVLIALFFYILFKWRLNVRLRKQKDEVEKLHLELNLLNSQMNPHFMFNTINSIQLYILEKSKHQAIQYLSDFAKLLRQSLDFSFNNFILIKDEIDFLNRYIELENKRFNENFILETNFSNTIDVNSDKIPAFLLQPVIENIIQHAHYEKDKIKKIEFEIDKIDNYILIQIKDFGINQPIISTKIKKHKSYGLNIIRKRLKIYNGKKYKESDLLIVNDLKNNNGYTVTIKLYLNEYNNS